MSIGDTGGHSFAAKAFDGDLTTAASSGDSTGNDYDGGGGAYNGSPSQMNQELDILVIG